MATETKIETPKKEKLMFPSKNPTKIVLNPEKKFTKENFSHKAAIELVKSTLKEIKADRVGQSYTKADYDKCYSSPRFVLADPDTPASLADLAYRVIMVSTEEVDENEDFIRGLVTEGKKDSPETIARGRAEVVGTKASHKNIVDIFNKSTPEERTSGKNWYEDVHHITRAIAKDTGHSTATVAGLIGNYSPQTDWATNLHTAARVARTRVGLGGPRQEEGNKVKATDIQRTAADRMMKGEHWEGVLGKNSHKVRAFTHLIEHGGNENPEKPHVAIDRHAASVAMGGRLSEAGYKYGLGGLKSKDRYDSFVQHYHNAAKEINAIHGTNYQAHEIQAITWLAQQRLNEGKEMAASKNGRSTTGARAAKAKVKWGEYQKQYHPNLPKQQPGTGYQTK